MAVPPEWRLVAQRGSPAYLLVQTRETDGVGYGRVWVRQPHDTYLGPEMPLQGIIKFGYWEPFTDQSLLAELDGVEVRDFPRRERSGSSSSVSAEA